MPPWRSSTPTSSTIAAAWRATITAWRPGGRNGNAHAAAASTTSRPPSSTTSNPATPPSTATPWLAPTRPPAAAMRSWVWTWSGCATARSSSTGRCWTRTRCEPSWTPSPAPDRSALHAAPPRCVDRAGGRPHGDGLEQYIWCQRRERIRCAMACNFLRGDRGQSFLLPQTYATGPEGHLAWFVLVLVEGVPDTDARVAGRE